MIRPFKNKKGQIITDKTCLYADPETATEGLGVSQNNSAKWAIDLTKEDWFAYEDNFGTTEEKNFVLHFKGLVERLQKSFAKIWLVRNEQQLCIYSFKDGRRFEPDYVLFLKRKKNSKKTEQIQVFVEPKGDGYIATDKWKEDFLLELSKEGRPVFDIADTTEYKIVGCHFYNEADVKRKKCVSDEILSLCGANGNEEFPADLKYREYLPIYSLEAACRRFGNQETVEATGWVKVSGVRKKNVRLFAVRAEGRAMEPTIRDGDICVFESQDGACDNNDIVLVEYSDVVGDENMGAYTIKKFVGRRKNGEYVSARLVPTNSDYDEIKLKNEGRCVRQHRIVGVWRRKIKVV